MHTAVSQPYPVVSQVNVPAGLGGWGEYPPPRVGVAWHLPHTVSKRTLHILLEYFLVLKKKLDIVDHFVLVEKRL